MSKYSKQFKLKVVHEFLKSGGQKRVAHLFEISHAQVRNWVLAYQSEGPAGLDSQYHHHPPTVQSSGSGVHGQAPDISQTSCSPLWDWQYEFDFAMAKTLQ